MALQDYGLGPTTLPLGVVFAHVGRGRDSLLTPACEKASIVTLGETHSKLPRPTLPVFTGASLRQQVVGIPRDS